LVNDSESPLAGSPDRKGPPNGRADDQGPEQFIGWRKKLGADFNPRTFVARVGNSDW